MRAFFALEIEQEGVLGELYRVQGELNKTGADIKLVERENLHYTVKFFGEISEAQVDEIDRRLLGLDLRSMHVEVGGLGAFPQARHPRVVWAGVGREDQAKVVELGELVIRTVEGIGQPEDHKFHPHVTLARVRSGRNSRELSSFLESNAGHSFGKSSLKLLVLKSSTLTPRGPIYRNVKTFELK